MAESELHRKGNEIRRRLLGDKYVERVNATTYQDPIMRTFIDVATENVFGALWSRPGLDLKTRTLVCVVSDAATGREPELRIHLRMALGQGWTEQELVEVLIHMWSPRPQGPSVSRARLSIQNHLERLPILAKLLICCASPARAEWHFPCTFLRAWHPGPISLSSTMTRSSGRPWATCCASTAITSTGSTAARTPSPGSASPGRWISRSSTAGSRTSPVSTSRPGPWCAWCPTRPPAGSPSCESTCAWRSGRAGPSRSWSRC